MLHLSLVGGMPGGQGQTSTTEPPLSFLPSRESKPGPSASPREGPSPRSQPNYDREQGKRSTGLNKCQVQVGRGVGNPELCRESGTLRQRKGSRISRLDSNKRVFQVELGLLQGLMSVSGPASLT